MSKKELEKLKKETFIDAVNALKEYFALSEFEAKQKIKEYDLYDNIEECPHEMMHMTKNQLAYAIMGIC